MTGSITKLVTDRGFGFITPDRSGQKSKDIFFHVSTLQKGLQFESLIEGQRVDFDVTHDEEKGRDRAVNVKLV